MTAIPTKPAFSGLLPHPPIVIPAVGRARLDECRSTHDACRDFSRRLLARNPDRVVLVSPHAPRADRAFGVYSGATLRGDLSQFGVREVDVALPNDTALVATLSGRAAADGVATWEIDPRNLDHGAVVPLWFLAEAGWEGPTCVISLPRVCNPAQLARFGRDVGEAVDRQPGQAALVASGDMTHKALPGAPEGYEERAVQFDRQLCDLVSEGRLDAIGEIDPSLREVAAEDAADSAMVVAAAIGHRPHGHEVLSYEHPFGVGYLVAVFHDGGEQEER